MSPFEIVMLASFGVAWPISIAKSIKSKSTKGKSVIFLLIVFIGYVAGTLHKVLYLMDGVIVLYIINGLLVATDIVIYYRNKKLEAI